jgi:hypothetical protein
MNFYYIRRDEIVACCDDSLSREDYKNFETALENKSESFKMNKLDPNKIGWFPKQYEEFTCWFNHDNIKKDSKYKEYCRLRKQTIDNQIEHYNSKMYRNQCEIEKLTQERNDL